MTASPLLGLELPSGYIGTWLGTVKQVPSDNNPASFKVVFTGGKLGERIGRVTLGPSGGCGGDSSAELMLQDVTGDTITVRFTNNTTNCLDPIYGPATARMVGGQLDWDLHLTYGEWRGAISRVP